MKNKCYFTVYSVVLVLVTACFFQFAYPPPRDALADQYACIRQDLDAKLMNGNVGYNQQFTIIYTIPTCYASNGYSITNTYIYQGNMVAVTYTNPNFKKASALLGGSTGGGMTTIP